MLTRGTEIWFVLESTTHTHTQTHRHSHTYTHTYIHIQIHTHTHTNTNTGHTLTHIHIQIHTHTHTHTNTGVDNFIRSNFIGRHALMRFAKFSQERHALIKFVLEKDRSCLPQKRTHLSYWKSNRTALIDLG